MKSTRKYNFVFSTTVWGREYLDLLINYTLPSMITPKNLPAVAKFMKCHFVVYASIEDFGYLAKSKVFIDLSKTATISRRDRKETINDNHRDIFRQAHNNEDIAMVFAPDQIYVDGSLVFSATKIIEGHSCVIIPSAAIRADVAKLGDGVKNDYKSIYEFLLSNMHSETKGFMGTSKEFDTRPVQKITNIEGGLLVNSYLYQPIMADCKFGEFSHDNIELNFVPGNLEKSVYFVNDSRECFYVGLSKDPQHGRQYNIFSEGHLTDYAARIGAGDFNRRVYETGFRILS